MMTERGYELDGRPVDPVGCEDLPAAPRASSLPEWYERALCRHSGPDFFFPTSSAGAEGIEEFCARCPVRVECREYALEERIEHGWWGGLSERARRRILRRRRNARRGSGSAA